MNFNKDIKAICDYSIGILFTQSLNNISKIRKSTVDIQASLLSELSFVNSEIQDTINFNVKTICNEYIDSLIKEITDINNKTMQYDKVSAIADLSSSLLSRISFSSDEKLNGQLQYVQSKISSILKYDIQKSVNISPISSSKVTDFVLSARGKAEKLGLLCNDIKQKIIESEYLMESCDFCIYYLKKNYVSTESYAAILEEPRETIINELTIEYMKWKEAI